jgi:C-terminal processing protease CtpA/Prc
MAVFPSTDYSGAPIGSNPAMISSWRYSTEEEAVGVGCYFGRIDGQTDSVARVKNIVSGGPAEQCGVIHVGDAVIHALPHHLV